LMPLSAKRTWSHVVDRPCSACLSVLPKAKNTAPEHRLAGGTHEARAGPRHPWLLAATAGRSVADIRASSGWDRLQFYDINAPPRRAFQRAFRPQVQCCRTDCPLAGVFISWGRCTRKKPARSVFPADRLATADLATLLYPALRPASGRGFPGCAFLHTLGPPARGWVRGVIINTPAPSLITEQPVWAILAISQWAPPLQAGAVVGRSW